MGLRVPISWLNDYVSTSDPETLAERLTLAGLEIEMVEYIGEQWQDHLFFVAEVREVSPHPNADRLCLVKVDYGQETPLVVVCGAPNLCRYENTPLPASLKVPLALIGATLMEAHREEKKTIRLTSTKIRGVSSEGVLCSEKELGLSDNHEGVMILPQDAPVGTSLKSYLGDAVFHFDIKGGFSHLLAIFGIARETAALTEVPLHRELMDRFAEPANKIVAEPPFVKLEIGDPHCCSRYSALLIEGIQVGPSPFWMQQRLLRAGMRPINNIVDITNYVMLEMGQPLHAFDHDLLQARAGGDRPTIHVRCAKEGETLTTLDGTVHTLDHRMLLITDSKGAIAIAGVMGGVETEISEKTTQILLESANFEFLNNRRTSQILKVRTEASERFGKRIDPELTLTAAIRAAQLMVEYAGGRLHEVYGDLYLQKKETVTIELDSKDVQRLLGIDLSQEEIIRILEKLEFHSTPGVPLQVTVPSHRMDIQMAADLVEEVARVYGYNRMAGTLMDDELPKFHLNAKLLGIEKVRDLMVEIGLDEIISYSIIDLQDEARVNLKERVDGSQYIGLKNPLTAERTHLRRSLLPGAFSTARKNLRFRDRVAVFEVGSIYLPQDNQILPEEPTHLCILMTGDRYLPSWMHGNDPEKIDFYDLKGVVASLLAGFHIENAVWHKNTGPSYHPGRCAEILIAGKSLGFVGEIHPKISQRFELPEQPVCVAELDLSVLLAHWDQDHPMSELSVYAPIYEDLAFVVDESVPAGEVESLILQVGGSLLEKVLLFDVFRGDRVGDNKKSLAYALTYQAFDRTLTDQDVAPIREKIIKHLKHQLNAELRV